MIRRVRVALEREEKVRVSTEERLPLHTSALNHSHYRRPDCGPSVMEADRWLSAQLDGFLSF